MRKLYFSFFLLLCPWLVHGQATSTSLSACIEGDSVVNIVMDYSQNCPEAEGAGLLAGLDQVAVHSGANGWASVVAWDSEDMQPAVNDGDDFFTFRVNPSTYYGVELVDLVNINVIPNQGLQNPSDAWGAAMRDSLNSDGPFGPSPCSDMIVIIEELANCDGSGGGTPHISACETDSGTVQIVFDYNQNCPEEIAENGSLAGSAELGFHSGINDWATIVAWDDEGAKTATNDGNDLFTVEFDPLAYYGKSLDEISVFNFLYNQGPAVPDDAWARAGRDSTDGESFGNPVDCSNFLIMREAVLGCGQDPVDPEPEQPHIEVCTTDSGNVKFIFDNSQNCPEAPGSLAGMNEIGFHSGINNWARAVAWDSASAVRSVNDGSDVFSHELNPLTYYGLPLDSIATFHFTYNQGPEVPSAPWESTGKDSTNGGFGGNEPCSDFLVMTADIKSCSAGPAPEIPHISGCITDSNTVQLVFDYNQNCPEAPGSLAGMNEIGFHSGINGWATIVAWNDTSAATGVNDGNDVFTVNVDPLAYYGSSLDSIVNITFTFNQGIAVPTAPWDATGRDTLDGGFGGNEPCSDFDLLIADMGQCSPDTTEPFIPEIPHIAGCITDSGTVQIVFDNKQNCPEAELEGNLDGMAEIGFHSGINDWALQTPWNDPGAVRAQNDGNDVFTVEINPLTYYGTSFTTLDSVQIINFLYNQGPAFPDDAWTVTGKDSTDGGGFGNNEPCSNFGLVLADLPYCRVQGPAISGCVTDSNTVKIVFDNYQNCPEAEEMGNLDGMLEIGFHSGVNNWSVQTPWNDPNAKTAQNNGLDIYTVEFNPVSYYGLPLDSISEINFLYNQGPAFPDDPWSVTGKDSTDGGGFGNNEPCSNFLLLTADMEACETPPLPLAACFTEDNTLQIEFDYNQNCPEATLNGSFSGQQMIGFHSGINNWSIQVPWDNPAAVHAVNNGRNMYSLEINPAEYYGVSLDSISEFNFLFNQGPAMPDDPWSAQGQSAMDGGGFGNASPCSNFQLLVADIQTCSSVGIDRRIVDLGMKVYPNPFSDQVTVEFKDSDSRFINLYLVDMNGRVVLSQENLRDNVTTISRGDLSSGVYMLMLRNETGQIDYEKLVIQ